jgi:hypothetical protein
VLVCDLGPLPEIVKLSGGGITYRDDAELFQARVRLAASPSLRRELGDSGYSVFLQYWTHEAYLNQSLDLLDQAATAKFGSVPWEMGAQRNSDCQAVGGGTVRTNLENTDLSTSLSGLEHICVWD